MEKHTVLIPSQDLSAKMSVTGEICLLWAEKFQWPFHSSRLLEISMIYQFQVWQGGCHYRNRLYGYRFFTVSAVSTVSTQHCCYCFLEYLPTSLQRSSCSQGLGGEWKSVQWRTGNICVQSEEWMTESLVSVVQPHVPTELRFKTWFKANMTLGAFYDSQSFGFLDGNVIRDPLCQVLSQFYSRTVLPNFGCTWESLKNY